MASFPTASNWPAGGALPAAGAFPTAGSFPSGGAFNGNFASLFTGVLQSVQTDLGLTYGVTMLATGAAPPVVTLTGSTASVPLPIKITTSAGVVGVATYTVSHDGGVTTPQTGTTAASVPITALPGLSIAFPAGPYMGDENYLATCAGLADQSGGNSYSQASATSQPVINVGVNGFAGLGFDGVNDALNSGLNLSAPGTTPCFYWGVLRQDGWTLNTCPVGPTGASFTMRVLQNAVTPRLRQSTTGATPASGIAIGSFLRMEAFWNNAISDYIKSGNLAPTTGTAVGNTANATGTTLGNNNAGTLPCACTWLALVVLNNLPSGAQLAAASAAVVSKYGAGVLV